MHALGLEFGSAAQLSKRPGSVWNCLWGNALKRSPGIIRKSRVSYPGLGFLSSATWPSLSKKHYNGLNQHLNSDILYGVLSSDMSQFKSSSLHKMKPSLSIGWLCFTSLRQRGHLVTAPPFTVPCEGLEAWLIHCTHRESNPGPSLSKHGFI